MASSSRVMIIASAAGVAGFAVGIGVGMVLTKRERKGVSPESDLPMFSLTGVDVHLIDGMQQLERLADSALKKLSSDQTVIVGLDTEWAQGQRLALLQIALPEACWLLRLRKLAVKNREGVETFVWPCSFVQLLVHPSMVYTGSGVKKDLLLVKDQLGIDLQKFVELQTVAKRERLDNTNGIGLQGLTKTVLGCGLSKNPAIRCGNWEAEVLSKAQVDYAAADAMVGREILLAMYACSDSGAKASADLATWLLPLFGSSKSKKQRVTQENSGPREGGETGQVAKGKKAKREATEAEASEKAGWVAAAISRARQPYTQGSSGACLPLSDPAVVPGLVVRASSSAPDLPPENCLALCAGNEWFLPGQDWRAERKAAVSFDGPAIAGVEVGRSCHWLELEFPTGVRPSFFALRCTASAACHTNGPTSWLFQASTDAAPNPATWVTLHAAGVSRAKGFVNAGPGLGDTKGGNLIAPTQEWDYDTTYFANGDIPGDTRFFQLSAEASATRFRRLRWTFLSEAKSFSVNLSGVLLFGFHSVV